MLRLLLAIRWPAVLAPQGRKQPADCPLTHPPLLQYAVDASRVCASGFSDGASYALTLGAANGQLFTHIAAFSPVRGCEVPCVWEGVPCGARVNITRQAYGHPWLDGLPLPPIHPPARPRQGFMRPPAPMGEHRGRGWAAAATDPPPTLVTLLLPVLLPPPPPSAAPRLTARQAAGLRLARPARPGAAHRLHVGDALLACTVRNGLLHPHPLHICSKRLRSEHRLLARACSARDPASSAALPARSARRIVPSLLAQGYQVTVREFKGGHTVSWEGPRLGWLRWRGGSSSPAGGACATRRRFPCSCVCTSPHTAAGAA